MNNLATEKTMTVIQPRKKIRGQELNGILEKRR
jgi:hypothetical protein